MPRPCPTATRNLDNDRLGTQYLAMNRANSIPELQAAQEEYQGIPLFNTIAAGADGSVWYADTAATPNLSPEAIAAYEERLEQGGLTALAADSGAVLLEGNTARDRWIEDPEAPWPGVLPWSALPQLERDDYVVNANDSYWVTNADAFVRRRVLAAAGSIRHRPECPHPREPVGRRRARR